LRSIVFPRNQVNGAYLPVCARMGLIAFRGTPSAWMHEARAQAETNMPQRAARLLDAYVPLPAAHAKVARAPGPAGLVDVPASRFFRPRPRSRLLRALDPLKVGRVVGELERAARDGAVYHLWWHPHNFGVEQEAHLAQLDAVLSRFARLRDEGMMRSLTMSELALEQSS
jgi:hypothetical protein